MIYFLYVHNFPVNYIQFINMYRKPFEKILSLDTVRIFTVMDHVMNYKPIRGYQG